MIRISSTTNGDGTSSSCEQVGGGSDDDCDVVGGSGGMLFYNDEIEVVTLTMSAVLRDIMATIGWPSSKDSLVFQAASLHYKYGTTRRIVRNIVSNDIWGSDRRLVLID